MKLQSLLSRQWANQRPGGGSIIKKILKITVLFFVADANLGLSQVPLIPPVPPGVTATHVSGEDAQCSLSDTAGNIVWAWGTDAGCEKWMNEAKNKQFTAPEPPSFKITPSNTFQPTLPGELTPEQITQYDKMIPATCDAPSALSDMSDGIPEIIGVGPDAARISKIYNYEPRQPAISGPSGTLQLFCNISVTWSNGLVQYGQFQESIDQYGQKVGSFLDPDGNPY